MPCNSPRWHATKRASKAAGEESLRYVKKEYAIPFVADEWRRRNRRAASVSPLLKRNLETRKTCVSAFDKNNGVSGNISKISQEVRRRRASLKTRHTMDYEI